MHSFLLARCRNITCALAGIFHLVRTQRNAWIHAAATFGVIVLGILLGLSSSQWCWLAVAIGAVWVAEALNTAVELLADALMPHHHPLVGRAKDVAAGGVLLAACMAVIIGLCILAPPLFTPKNL
jgi:diacylglycerol kinase